MSDATVPDAARCRGCGYPLRQLTTGRCPECGRPFDPADVSTMDVGRSPGPLGRWLLRPAGWLWPVLAVVAAILVVTATRWPAGDAKSAADDLRYYLPGGRFDRDRLLSYTDYAYAGGLLLSVAVVVGYGLRTAARLAVQRRYRRPPEPVHLGRRMAMLAIAAVGTAAVIGGQVVGGPYRLARVWARQLLAATAGQPANPPVYAPPLIVPPPVAMTLQQQADVLETGILHLPTTAERTACLRLSLEATVPFPKLPALLTLMPRQTDPAVRATIARMVGLYRDPATVEPLMALWDDPDADVRAAITDAVGLVHRPAYPLPNQDFDDSVVTTIASEPPIPLKYLLPGSKWDMAATAGGLERLRPRLVDRMFNGRTDVERQAAARALLPWPEPGYRLRVAEWGVWLANDAGALALLPSLIEEIPPFVHRTGDAVATMAPRINTKYDVLKPILHLTVDRPMAIDVQVVITDGRPWFAYPKPDDYKLAVLGPGGGDPSPVHMPPLSNFDHPALPPLDNPHEGYPWVDPPHETVTTSGVAGISGMGLRWQSVIVSPGRQPWMVPPAVPADPKFAWWDRLRQVDCSWVSNRGEAERFLYYDGPTAALAPVSVRWDGRSVRFASAESEVVDAHHPHRCGDTSSTPLVTHPRPADAQGRLGLFIRVTGGHVAATALGPSDPGESVDVTANPLAGEAAVAAALHGMLTTAGLSDGEAAGLVDCWRPQWFHTNGQRFLLLLTAADYDALCPLRVDPPPTELARVGLVMTEFA